MENGTYCGECGLLLASDVDTTDERQPCPNCGARTRLYVEHVHIAPAAIAGSAHIPDLSQVVPVGKAKEVESAGAVAPRSLSASDRAALGLASDTDYLLRVLDLPEGSKLVAWERNGEVVEMVGGDDLMDGLTNIAIVIALREGGTTGNLKEQ